MAHPDHSDQLQRLQRAKGQLDGVGRMIEEKRYCPEVIYQLRAVQKALSRVEINVLTKHLDNCVAEVMTLSDKKQIETKIEELSKLLKNTL